MRDMLDNSLCFGLYDIGESRDLTRANGTRVDAFSETSTEPSPGVLVGFARCVTDFVTFVYLTDVYVDSHLQGKGLGSWMMICVREMIESMPFLRRSMLFTSNWEQSVPLYRRVLGMEVVRSSKDDDEGGARPVAIMQRPGPAFPVTSPEEQVS